MDVLPARNELPVEAGAHASEALNRLLVEMLDVALCVRHAHWNARGPDYLPVHEILEEIGGQLDRQADRVAIRMRALGAVVHVTSQRIVTESSIKPYPVEVSEGQDHMAAIALRLGLLSAEARLSIYDSHGLADPATVQLIAQVNSAIDHALWRVESHLSAAC
jgi:starvation-inducible DNA-binding protein